jgi:hypothetical protein
MPVFDELFAFEGYWSGSFDKVCGTVDSADGISIERKTRQLALYRGCFVKKIRLK